MCSYLCSDSSANTVWGISVFNSVNLLSNLCVLFCDFGTFLFVSPLQLFLLNGELAFRLIMVRGFCFDYQVFCFKNIDQIGLGSGR